MPSMTRYLSEDNLLAASNRIDTLSPAERSVRMGRVKGKDTKPELIVRRLVHSLGYRYRLHRRDLPGCPDLCFPSLRKLVFVHGCFWHRHDCKLGNRLPKSRVDFWKPKLEANQQRDRQHQTALRRLGWQNLVVWECELAHKEQLKNKLVAFLGERNEGNRAIRGGGRPWHGRK